MPSAQTIAVLGGGNGAFATAADLKLKGHRVHLLEAPELADRTIAPIKEAGGIQLQAANVPGVSAAGFAAVDVITDDPAEALDGADLVLYVVPAFAERRFTELCRPHFRPDQLVVLFCGNFGGALELSAALGEGGGTRPLIAETEGFVYAGFKQDPATVKVSALKAGLTCAALPTAQTGRVMKRLLPLFPGFQPAANVLETGLRNMNPVVHAPVSVLNAGRTGPGKARWRYYWEGVTPEIGRAVEQVDRERLAVAAALDLELPSMLEVLLTWYGSVGARGKSVAEVLSTNPAYEIVWAPETLDHRFLTEDVPFGLVPVEALGAALGVPTPTISALVTLTSNLLGRDFREQGRHLARLGLAGLSGAQIKERVLTA